MNALSTAEIVAEISRIKGSYSLAAFYRHKQELKLFPVGARQHPQRYPADTVQRILAHFGLAQSGVAAPREGGKARLLSVPQLKAAMKGGRK